MTHTLVRQAIPIVWDFVEVNPFSAASGNLQGALEWVSKVCETEIAAKHTDGEARCASATNHPLPHDSADVLETDPP